MHPVRHLKRSEIDTEKWDRCVSTGRTPLVFGLSHFLDIMAGSWDGFVYGEYEAVLPVATRRRLGICYGYPTRFTAPHPIYGSSSAHIDPSAFIEAVARAFSFSDLQLAVSPDETPVQHTVRRNHRLSLAGAYDDIRSGYNATCRNLLSKAAREGIATSREVGTDEAIGWATRDGMMQGCTRSDLSRFRVLCRELKRRGECFTVSSMAPDGSPLSVGIFFVSAGSIHYMASWTGQEGRQTGASRLVIDAVVREHSGSGMTLDFMGSDIPGIAAFFEGFGAEADDCVLIRQNRLPRWIAWVKPPLEGAHRSEQPKTQASLTGLP